MAEMLQGVRRIQPEKSLVRPFPRGMEAGEYPQVSVLAMAGHVRCFPPCLFSSLLVVPSFSAREIVPCSVSKSLLVVRYRTSRRVQVAVLVNLAWLKEKRLRGGFEQRTHKRETSGSTLTCVETMSTLFFSGRLWGGGGGWGVKPRARLRRDCMDAARTLLRCVRLIGCTISRSRIWSD